MCKITTLREKVDYLERRGGFRILPCTALRVHASPSSFEVHGVRKAPRKTHRGES